MTRAAFHEHRHLLPPVHLAREISRGLDDRQKMVSGDYDFALGHENAVGCSAVDDTRDAASKIPANNRIHNVSRQAKAFRQKRVVLFEHLGNPLPHSEATLCSLSDTGRKLNCTIFPAHKDAQLVVIASICYDFGTHDIVHSGTNCTSSATGDKHVAELETGITRLAVRSVPNQHSQHAQQYGHGDNQSHAEAF